MSDDTVLLAVGLGLGVVATLFISLDAFRSQRQTTEIYEILGFITGLEVINRRTQPAREEADRRSAQARATLRSDAPGEQSELSSRLKELDQADTILIDAERAADQKNREILQVQLNKVADDFSSRRYLIAAAIVAVFVGGVCELIGGVVLGT